MASFRQNIVVLANDVLTALSNPTGGTLAYLEANPIEADFYVLFLSFVHTKISQASSVSLATASTVAPAQSVNKLLTSPTSSQPIIEQGAGG